MKKAPKREQRQLFGHLLKQKNLITEEQLQQALDIQRTRRAQLNDPTHLGQILVQLGYAEEMSRYARGEDEDVEAAE